MKVFISWSGALLALAVSCKGPEQCPGTPGAEPASGRANQRMLRVLSAR